MTWLTPMVGIVAASIAASVLIVLYLLKLRRREVEVSSTFLWSAVIRDMRANAPFQKLRKNILLLLQAIALALAALALAQPGFMGERSPAETTVILIDHSASMSAREPDGSGGTPTRLDRAKEEARRIVKAATSGMSFTADRPRAMVISFASSPTVLVAPTSDASELLAAIDSIGASESMALLAPAMQLAEAHARDNPTQTRIVVLSDGAFADEEASQAPLDAELEYIAIGSGTVDNAGIVSLRAQRSYDKPERVTVFVAVDANAGARESAEIELTIDGEIIAVRRTPLIESETTGARSGAVVVQFNRLRSAVIRTRVLSEDALAADDEAWIALPPAAQPKVTVVTTGNPLMERALRASAIALPVVITPGEYIERARRGAIIADVVIFEDFSPPDDALPTGSYLSFGPPPPIEGIGTTRDPDQSGSDGSVSAFVSWRVDHPALEYAGLEKVRISTAHSFEVEDQRDVIARLTSGPGIVEIDHDGRRAICVAFDPLDSNWPFDRGYVLFLATAIDYLAGAAGAEATTQLRPGDTLATALPPSARDIQLIGPDGAFIEPTIRERQLTHTPLRSRGVYEVSWRGAGERGDEVRDGRVVRRFACSSLDPSLTALRVYDTVDLSEHPGGLASTAPAQSVPRSLRNWIILGFLGLILFEWYVYHRRVEL